MANLGSSKSIAGLGRKAGQARGRKAPGRTSMNGSRSTFSFPGPRAANGARTPDRGGAIRAPSPGVRRTKGGLAY